MSPYPEEDRLALGQVQPGSECDCCGAELHTPRHISIEWNGWHTSGSELCPACTAAFLEHTFTFMKLADLDTLRALIKQMDDLEAQTRSVPA